MGVSRKSTYITSKILLLAQDDLVSIKLAIKLTDELLHTLLIRFLPVELLEKLLIGNVRRVRVKVRIFDTGRLLELGTGLGLCRDQLWARAERREVPSDGARFVKPEAIALAIVLLIVRQNEKI
jgi:hypothetical protein